MNKQILAILAALLLVIAAARLIPAYAFLGGIVFPPGGSDEEDGWEDSEDENPSGEGPGGEPVDEPEEPDDIGITRIYSWNSDPLLVPLGASDEALAALIEDYNAGGIACRVDLDDGRDFVPVRLGGWAPELLDVSEEGQYYPLLLDLPPGVVFCGQTDIPVWVLDPDRVTLRVFTRYDTSLWVEWIKPLGEPELWVSADGGDWAPAPEGTFLFRGGKALSIQLNELHSLLGGGRYDFHIRYEDDGVSADMLCADYAGGSVTHEPFEGKRTGESRGENELPYVPLPSPPPSPPPSPSPSPSPAPSPSPSPSPAPPPVPSPVPSPSPAPTPSPSPVPSPSPIPVPSPAPSPTPTPEPSPSPTPPASPPEPTPESTPTPTPPTPAPTPASTPVPSPIPAPSPSPSPDSSPAPKPFPAARPAPVPEPAPVPAPAPTATPEPKPETPRVPPGEPPASGPDAPAPYSNRRMPVIAAAGIGLTGAGVFLGFRRKTG